MTRPLVRVKGAEVLDGMVVWPGSDRRRTDLAVHQRVWRFLGPAPMHLGEFERFMLATPLHWAVLVRDVTQMGAAPLGGYIVGQLMDLVAPAVWQIGALVWLTVVLHTLAMCHHMLGWRAQRLVVTSRRVVFVKGVFSNKVQNLNLAQHGNLDYEQSWVQRMLGYGTLIITTGGEHNDPSKREQYPWIPDPAAVVAAVYGTPGWV